MQNVDSVLGLSITSNAVGLVLVEGESADGEIIDREAIEVPADGTATATRAADQIAAAVARTKGIDEQHRLHAIGLTWSDDAGTEASLLLEALAKEGFTDVVPVRLPQASEAFAHGIGVVLGYSRTAVCVVESDGAIASMVDSRTDEMRASACENVDRDVVFEWLYELMAPDSWHPEALVVVGTGLAALGVDLAALGGDLEAALDIPVFAPEEAELALARGAALASVRSHEVGLAQLDDYTWEPVGGRARTRSRGTVVGMAALAAGAVTFVVSLSVAAGMQLSPDRDVTETAHRTVAAAPAPEPAPERPVVASVPEVPEVAPAPEVLPEPAPIPEEVYVPEEPVVAAPEPVYVPDAPVAVPQEPAPVVVAQPPVVVPQVPPVQEERPGFFTRIRERIQAIGDDPQPAQAPAPVPGVPPPGVIPIPGQP